MKKIVSFAMALMCVFTLSAQNDASSAKKDKKSKEPVILFEKTVHDYGNIHKGDNGVCEFVFKNTGKSDLVLTNVRSSCGCTVPDWPKNPIPPKKSAVIKVKYDTHRVGPINKNITVESNAENNRVVLNIKGNVSDKSPEKAPENTRTSLAVPN